MSGFLQHLVAKGRGEIQRLSPRTPQPFENETPSPAGMRLDVKVTSEAAAVTEFSRVPGLSPGPRPVPSQSHPTLGSPAPPVGPAASASPIAATPAQPIPARRAMASGQAASVAPAAAPAVAPAMPAVARPAGPLPAPPASPVLSRVAPAASQTEMFSRATRQGPPADHPFEAVVEIRPVVPEQRPRALVPEDPVAGPSSGEADPPRVVRYGDAGDAAPQSMPRPVLPPARAPSRATAAARPSNAVKDRRAPETPIVEVLIDTIEVVGEAPIRMPARPSARPRELSLDAFLDGAS